jgi:hypothetical protein
MPRAEHTGDRSIQHWKEFSMTRLHRAGTVLAGLVVTLLTLGGASPSFASTTLLDPPPGGSGTAPAVSPAHPLAPAVRTIVAGGMPGWQITLIAIAAALVAATAAVLLDRARTVRQRVSVTHARQTQAATPR